MVKNVAPEELEREGFVKGKTEREGTCRAPGMEWEAIALLSKGLCIALYQISNFGKK